MSNYYEERLKARVKKRVRPFQYLFLHIFLFVATMIMMGVGTEFGLVSETAIMMIAIAFVISLLAHVFWRANEFIWQRIEYEEGQKLALEEKPKREQRMPVEDGELLDYDDYLWEDYQQQTSSSQH